MAGSTPRWPQHNPPSLILAAVPSPCHTSVLPPCSRRVPTVLPPCSLPHHAPPRSGPLRRPGRRDCVDTVPSSGARTGDAVAAKHPGQLLRFASRGRRVRDVETFDIRAQSLVDRWFEAAQVRAVTDTRDQRDSQQQR